MSLEAIKIISAAEDAAKRRKAEVSAEMKQALSDAEARGAGNHRGGEDQGRGGTPRSAGAGGGDGRSGDGRYGRQHPKPHG